MMSSKINYDANGYFQAASLMNQFFESYMYKLNLKEEIKMR